VELVVEELLKALVVEWVQRTVPVAVEVAVDEATVGQQLVEVEEGHEAKSGSPSVEWEVVPELETLPLVEAAACEQALPPPAGNPLAWAVNPSQLPNLKVQEPVGHAYPVDVIEPSGLNLLAH
jgi:hypothetical protein